MAREAPSNGEVFSKRRSRAAIVSLGAAFALVLLLVLVGEALTPGAADRQPGHNSWSYGTQGFRAFYEVLESLGYQVERFRRTYHALPPGEEAILLSLDPGSIESIVQERTLPETDHATVLRAWVKAGGHLIITRPGRWLLSYGGFDIRFEEGEDSEDGAVTGDPPDSGEIPLLSRAARSRTLRALLEDLPGVRSHSLPSTMSTRPPLAELTAPLLALSPGQARALAAYTNGRDATAIDLFERVPVDAAALVSVGDDALALEYRIGRGRVICFSTAFPFTNGALRWTPAAEIVTQLVRHVSEGGRRRLYFDEFTHGFYRKSGLLRWARETALFYPLTTVLIGILLAGWYGAVRFGPPRRDREPSRGAREEFVLSLGDMYRRGRHYGHVLALIVEAYDARLARLLGSTAGEVAVDGNRASATARFSYRVPGTEREFLRETRRLHEEYLALVSTIRGKKTPRDE